MMKHQFSLFFLCFVSQTLNIGCQSEEQLICEETNGRWGQTQGGCFVDPDADGAILCWDAAEPVDYCFCPGNMLFNETTGCPDVIEPRENE